MKTVDDILESKDCVLWTIAPDQTVQTAILLMAEKNVGALPVLEAGQLVGIFSERDYTRKILPEGRDPDTTLVREIMTMSSIFVRPEQSIEECMYMMTFGQIRHLPVMIADEVIGIISIGDIVKALM